MDSVLEVRSGETNHYCNAGASSGAPIEPIQILQSFTQPYCVSDDFWDYLKIVRYFIIHVC